MPETARGSSSASTCGETRSGAVRPSALRRLRPPAPSGLDRPDRPARGARAAPAAQRLDSRRACRNARFGGRRSGSGHSGPQIEEGSEHVARPAEDRAAGGGLRAALLGRREADRVDLPWAVAAGRGRRRPRSHPDLVAVAADGHPERGWNLGRRGSHGRRRRGHESQARRHPGFQREDDRGVRRTHPLAEAPRRRGRAVAGGGCAGGLEGPDFSLALAFRRLDRKARGQAKGLSLSG